MFEVIISSVTTGQVRRKVFDTRAQAERHVDRFFMEPHFSPRCQRNYRVEVYQRPLPVVRVLPVGAGAENEAA